MACLCSAGAIIDAEAIAAMLCIAGGISRLVIRRLTQAARFQEINGLANITPEVVVIARESLVIGTQ